MRIAILHQKVGPGSPADEHDVTVQADAVAEALETLGHRSARVACTLDLEALKGRLAELAPDLVFNLVESLDGQDRLIHLVPSLLDALGLAYTGSPSHALYTASHKLMAKERMKSRGIPTPPWVASYGQESPAGQDPDGPDSCGTWIVKSLWEHASAGMDSSAIVQGDAARVRALLPARRTPAGGACFAEHFVDGREFNLSLLDGPRGPEVLPPAEILFEGFGDGRPRIVDYRAKWDEGSFEYRHTKRHFRFNPEDRPLLEILTRHALACWKIFELEGYARVDFRVDGEDRPWVLEVNVNPCLSPDAGFAAALDRAAISFPEGIARILERAATRP